MYQSSMFVHMLVIIYKYKYVQVTSKKTHKNLFIHILVNTLANRAVNILKNDFDSHLYPFLCLILKVF